MLIKTLTGIVAILCALVANAQTPSTTLPSNKQPATPEQILQQIKARSPLAQCSGMAKSGEQASTYSMADGSRYEFTYGENGDIVSVTAFSGAGRRVTVDAAEADGAASAKEPRETVGKTERSTLGAGARRAMDSFLKRQCARFARQESGEAGSGDAPESEQLTVAGVPGQDESMTGGGFDMGWDLYDFFAFSDRNLNAEFSSASAQYAQFVGAGAQLPKCTVVVKECSDFCGSIGQVEYSGCGALALAAGFTLGPPTGAAVGFYCSGNVYIATEQCRSRCQTPTVVCGPN